MTVLEKGSFGYSRFCSKPMRRWGLGAAALTKYRRASVATRRFVDDWCSAVSSLTSPNSQSLASPIAADGYKLPSVSELCVGQR
jgi:hypothetical protein